MTGTPWYWLGPHDHDSCGLVMGAGPNGTIHYVKAIVQDYWKHATACHSFVKDFHEIEYHGEVVTCRNCAAVARGPNKDRIKRRVVRPIILSHSRVAFVRREERRERGFGQEDIPEFERTYEKGKRDFDRRNE